MDRWLNDGPALAYVSELCAWVVVNNKGELISLYQRPGRARVVVAMGSAIQGDHKRSEPGQG